MQDRVRERRAGHGALGGVLILLLAIGCSPGTATSPTILSSGDNVLLAAGDVGDCSVPGAQVTGLLLDSLPGTILALGDLAYPSGSRANFIQCYDPHWGRHRDRTMPVPGNHEYETPSAEPYFSYFGEPAGSQGAGYYSFTSARWLIIALNSEIPMGNGSAQLAWLRGQLTASTARCTLAYWHRPLFSSGPNGNNPDVQPLFRALYDAGADLVLSGHDHNYERFAPQDPDGRADPARGIRQMVVGTGGAPLSPAFGSARANSEARASEWGMLKLTLTGSTYAWEFMPVSGAAFRDAGAAQCH